MTVSIPVRALQLDGKRVADVGLVPMAEASASPTSPNVPPRQIAPSGGDDERVVDWVQRVVVDEHGAQVVEVERRLREDAARRGDVGRVQRREARIAAEDPEDADALVRAQRRALAVDRSLARVIAVEKPMQYSVPWTSLSMVLGIATSGTPVVAEPCE